MRLFFRLLSVQLNQRYGISALRAGFRENRKKAIGQAALMAVAVISIGVLVGMYAWLVAAMMPAFRALHQEHVLLGLVFMVSMVMVFFMGLVYLIGVLFFSKDTEFLASLPIPQRTVFAAKFSQVYLGELGVGCVLLLPPCIIYGIQLQVGAAFWLRLVITTLFVPCIPLAISGLLSLLLMRFSALWRRRDLLAIIGSMLLLVAIIAVQMLLTYRLPETITPGSVLALVSSNERMLRMISSAFPPSGWAAQGLLNGGGPLLLYLAVSCVSLAIVLLISGKLYYSGAMAQLETAAATKAVRLRGRAVRRHSPLFALWAREWRCVFRSPAYAMNGLVAIIIGPLMMLMPLAMQGAMQGDMEQLMTLLEGMVDPYWVVFAMAAIFCMIGLINPSLSTSISREGKLFYLMRTLPASASVQILAKLLFGFSVSALTIVLMGLASMFVLPLTVGDVLFSILLALVVSIAPVILSLLPDLLRPKLEWNSETEAIKQNFNGILGMLISWLYVFVLGVGVFLLLRAKVSGGLVYGIVLGISALAAALSFVGVRGATVRCLHRVEG